MSLLTKTTLLLLLVASLVFGIGGVVTYRMVKKEVQKETDYYLNETYRRIVKAIEDGKPVKALTNDKVIIQPLAGNNWPDTLAEYSDTLGMHPFFDRLEPYRKLKRVKEVNGTYYYISLMDVLIESDDMYEGVVSILSRLFIFLSLALLLFSFLISRWLLGPFQETLHRISRFNLKEQSSLTLPQTTTKEFRQLNSFIEKMANKAQDDYLSLKEFTENASHEMQTPVAVAKGKLELLLESSDLTEQQVELVQTAYASVSKLSRIGQSLALLNKIGNREFSAVKPVNFSRIVNQSISHFQELIELKELRLTTEVREGVQLSIDPALADVLFSNLLKNAVQHNDPGGWINVRLDQHQLQVENSGAAPSVSPHLLFNRFRKGNQSSGSLGLGLAIVKKIVDVHNWTILYDFANGIHRLQVDFS